VLGGKGLGDFFGENLWRTCVVKNHPFIDGNKRIGAVTAYVFLSINGIRLTASPDDFTEMVLAVAESRLDKQGIADLFRRNTEAS
jgi:death-on-curing protein